MRMVGKFALLPGVDLQMPDGSKIISCGFQADDLMIWALIDTDYPLRERSITVLGTGHEAPESIESATFVGTVMVGDLVFHVFDNGWVVQ